MAGFLGGFAINGASSLGGHFSGVAGIENPGKSICHGPSHSSEKSPRTYPKFQRERAESTGAAVDCLPTTSPSSPLRQRRLNFQFLMPSFHFLTKGI